MNQKLQKIIDIFQKTENLSTEEKDSVLKALKDTDKELEITAFKLERTEKVKKTTAILLEETIEELEHKRNAVEEQNRELEIESSLERVRAVAMSMNKSDDLLSICEISFKEFQKLGFHNLRNAIIHILNDEKESFMDYDFSDSMGGSITNIDYNSHPVVEDYLKQIKSAEDAFAEVVIEGSQLIDWKKFRRESGQHDDNRLDDIPALYYYFHSIGVGDIGISTFNPIDESQIKILKRFRNVFDLAYRTYTDITKAESQARESQIQLALERVRARTMAMHKSEELSETSFVLFEQLKELGEVAEQISIIIYNEEEGIIELYATIYGNQWEEIGKIPFQKHFVHRKIYNAWKENEKSFVIDLSGKELNDFNKFKMVHSAQYKSEDDLPQVRWVIHNAFFSKGALVFSTHEPRPLETIQLLERFAGVFEQTYTRFLDLKKAEAQARESQIELGLERVRARAMAMQKSDELSELVDTVFKELTKLDFALNWCIINIIDVSSLSNMVWAANPDIDKAPDSYHMKFEDYPFHDAMMKGYKERATKYIYVLEGLEKKVYDEYLFNETEFRKVPEEAQAASRAMDKYVCSFTFSNFGGLQTVGDEPLSDSNLDILERFGKVFDLTYTRFNDLQKAEAQAREAQIEAALERVRSRTMGMQKSEELKEVIKVVYEQFVHLNIHIEHTGFIMDYKTRDDMHIWLADQHEVPSEVTIPYFDCAHWNSFNEAKEKGMDFFANHLSFEEKNKFYQDLFKLIPGVPQETLEYYFSCPGLAISTVLLENVGLYIENFSGNPYSDEENDTLMRFGKVFQQTYTRFNDLKQAEEQAREAQIEAALEKVRSRTMAMQKSDELAETAYVLYEQFGLLGENPEQLTIGIIDETYKMWEFWLTLGGNQINHVFKASIDEPIVLNKSYIAWKERKKSIVIDISGDELKAYYNFFKNLPGYKEFNEFKNNQKPEHRRVINMAYFSNGSLSLSSPEPKPAETIQLLERFASVLEQTYTRFLDLQKAEAQTREAQIETALERVRSRSMAMHHTSELQDVINTVHQQFKILDIAITGGAFIAINEENKNEITCWGAGGTTDYIERVHIPFLDQPIYTGLIECIQKGTGFFTEEFSYEEKIEFFNHLFKHPPYIDTSPERKKEVLSRQGGYTRSCAVSKYTNIFIINHHGRKFSEEENNILMRFGKVFEQTYTRFLDLQNAEEQAREAQIEAALERVRSKAMAMHSSEDLATTVDTFFSELNALEVTPHRCGVGIVDAETRTTDIHANTSTHDNEIKKVAGKLKLSGHPVLDSIFENWKLQKEYHPVLHGNEIVDYYKVMDPQVKFPDFADDETQYGYYFYFKEGGVFAWTDNELTERDLQIFRRYTSVLSLTYRRYMDLKDAEVQAREAQVETALERVRARTMAMQRSEELAETAAVVFKQLIYLGIAPNRLYIGIINDESGNVDFWITDEDGSKVSEKFTGKSNRNDSVEKMYDGWKKKKKSVTIDMQGKELENYFQYLGNELHVPFKLGFSQKRRVQTIAYFSNGFIGIASPDEQPEETTILLERFAAVFNLTYTRFNDLQQAEAQNKIIQADNERKTKELEEARQLQLSMLPKELPKIPNLDIAVYMQTATEVGGDYYDFNVGIDGMLTTILGDATGHGMKAGTVVTITKSLFNSMAENENILRTFDNISQVIKGMKFRQLAMCLIMMKIKGNRLSMSSAAMPPALIYRAKNKTVEEILLKGMPLGTMRKFPYKKIESHLNTGDRILLYSDGLPELANNNDEMFGYDRIKTEFHSVGEKAPEEIVDHLKNSASQWANGKVPDDDVTFVVIKVK